MQGVRTDGGSGYYLFASGNLLHAVQCTACLEPTDLLFVERMVKLNFVDLAIFVLDFTVDGFAGCQLGQTQDGDLIGWSDL